MARRARRGLAGIALLALLFLAVPQLWAHAELLESYPAVGGVYRWERPAEVRLTFSQALLADGSEIVVTNRRFERVESGPTQLAPNDPATMVAALPNLSSGTYTVNWQTASVDGHTLSGAYEFTLLPREAIFTGAVAVVVLAAFGLLIFVRRARPGEA